MSLFSGCGGLDLGFRGDFTVFGKHYERHPFDVAWANDLNVAACTTYKKNLSDHIHCGDIWDHMQKIPSRADVVIGGFPCQDISVNGKRAGVSGVRSGLYKAMVEVVDRLKPKVFVAENVKGLLLEYNKDSLQQVISDFAQLGYQVSYDLCLAANYGVPQMRQRVFIVGTLADVKPFVPPPPVLLRGQWMSSEEAIGDLESLEENAAFNHIWSRAERSPDQGNRRNQSRATGRHNQG